MKSNNNEILIIAFNKGYNVDNDGNVFFKGKQRSLIYDSKGYYTFTIRCNLGNEDIFRRIWVHRLQAYQKYKEDIFVEGTEVRHKNGIKTDNSFDNILIGTHVDNMNDMDPEVRRKQALYASSFNHKHNHQEVIEYYSLTRSYKKTKEKFNISSSGTLNYIIKNKMDS